MSIDDGLLRTAKVCGSCGRELPYGSMARSCPHCGGPLLTRTTKSVKPT